VEVRVHAVRSSGPLLTSRGRGVRWDVDNSGVNVWGVGFIEIVFGDKGRGLVER
jgi:hypothetical protein